MIIRLFWSFASKFRPAWDSHGFTWKRFPWSAMDAPEANRFRSLVWPSMPRNFEVNGQKPRIALQPSRALEPREGGSRNSSHPHLQAPHAHAAPGHLGAAPPRPTVHRAQATPSDPRSRDPAPRTQKNARPLRHQADESGRSQAPKAPREATWRRYSAVAVSTSTEPSFSVAGPGRPAPTKASRAPRASRSFSARFALATAIISLMRLS